MRIKILLFATSVLAAVCAQVATAALATDQTAALTVEQKEEFLRHAAVEEIKDARKGITYTVRATLSDGHLTHDASVQRIDLFRAKFDGSKGSEFNFRDCYLFNVAAWKLAKMLGLESMVPPSVERRLSGVRGAFTWWIENVQMDEGERVRSRLQAPDRDRWSRETAIMHVFDELIYNTDRNGQNILYDKDWNLWMIDHTRAFRIRTGLMNSRHLEVCDRQMLEKMKELTLERLSAEVGPYLHKDEIRAILARRDVIVKYFESRPEKVFDYLIAGAERPK